MSLVYPYKIERICLKITGESLMQNGDSLSYNAIQYIINQIKYVASLKIKLCIVLGGGNIYRGIQSKTSGVNSAEKSDYMGMLATVINGIALNEALNTQGVKSSLYSAFHVGNIVKEFNIDSALNDFNDNKVVIFCGGTGHPYFTTDTAAVLRSLEMKVDLLLKATKVDGIYNKDPHSNKDAKKFSLLSYQTILAQQYNVMDQSAFALCRDNELPLVVFDFFKEGNLPLILKGSISGTLVLSQKKLEEIGLKEQ